MLYKTISPVNLNNFVRSLICSDLGIYGVQKKDETDNKYHFARLASAEDLALDYDVTTTPPKIFFTPPTETLLKFKTRPEVKITPEFDRQKRVLIGVHPYDMVAINQMDEVFKDAHEDAHYFSKRDSTIIIGLDPQNASKWAFWCHMGAGKVDTGYDIWITKLDNDTFFFEVKTEAGKKLLDNYASAQDALDEHVNRRNVIRENLHKVCNRERALKVSLTEIPALMKKNYDNPVWEEKAKKCYSCGSCNMVCPTCYCFDVRDKLEISLEGGARVRMWDGCQLENFAIVGSGENFRGKRVDRFKHRLYRKTLYLYEKFNHVACVGCGRCSSVCLPDIADPVDIINTLGENQ